MVGPTCTLYNTNLGYTIILLLDNIARDPHVGQLRGGGVNQLLPCLNNYASFKFFTRHSMIITIMQGNKQWHIQHQSHI
jgi:hypothetical protein